MHDNGGGKLYGGGEIMVVVRRWWSGWWTVSTDCDGDIIAVAILCFALVCSALDMLFTISQASPLPTDNGLNPEQRRYKIAIVLPDIFNKYVNY